LEINAKKNINDELLQNVEIRLNRGDKIVRKAYTRKAVHSFFEHVCGVEYWLRPCQRRDYKVIEQEFSIRGWRGPKHLILRCYFSEDDSCCAGIINLTVWIPMDSSP